MNHILILLIKLVTAIVAFSIGLDLFFDATFADVVSFSVLVTVISYMIGDRIILPRLGSRNATIVDFFLVYTSVWLFGGVNLDSYAQIAWGSIISAFILTAAEVVLHRFIEKQSAEEQQTGTQQKRNFNPRLAYGMEMAEEPDPRKPNSPDKK